MSEILKIRFAPDLPPMVVDVVAPDLQVVERVAVMPGRREANVSVPSESSFLCAHLATGERVVLGDRGSLDRQVTRDTIDQAICSARRRTAPPAVQRAVTDPQSREELRRYQWVRTGLPGREAGEIEALPIGRDPAPSRARVADASGNTVRGRAAPELGEAEWPIPGPPFERPFELEIRRPTGARIVMRVPGNATRLWVRETTLVREHALNVSVRVRTSNPVADTIMAYLSRGHILAAGTMTRWASEAERLLLQKMQDPYAAAVGAYLLLRLENFDLMHDWPRNLADWFDFLPDGCVIRAWQLMATDSSREAEIRDYLLAAATRGIPVFTEGLRLLQDGLKLLGEEGREALSTLRAQVGTVVRDSPLSMFVADAPRERDLVAVTYDVGFDPASE